VAGAGSVAVSTTLTSSTGAATVASVADIIARNANVSWGRGSEGAWEKSAIEDEHEKTINDKGEKSVLRSAGPLAREK
jgi:hypothetical protein